MQHDALMHREGLTLSSLHCHLHSQQASSCCHNHGFVVDVDVLKWVGIEKKILLLLKQLHKHFRSKTRYVVL